MLRPGVRTIYAAALLLPAACAVRQTPRTPEQLAAHRREFVQQVLEGRAELSRCVLDRIALEQEQAAASGTSPPILDILILSGGGDYGAFGAGVLKGWGTVADSGFTRPQFDVVTGVSTGALIAPFAFVGTDDAYEQAFCAYRDPKPHWFRVRHILSILLVRESFVDNSGLRKEIRTCLSDDMLRQIAQGRDAHRILLIGTTNLDLGMLTMWDATKLAHQAATGQEDRTKLDDVILASTAIPAIFPPVKIDGDLYVDGGVTRNIAYTTDQDFEHSAVNLWKSTPVGGKLPKIRVWVIINKQIGGAAEQLFPSWPSVMERSLEVSIRSSTINSLKALAVSLECLRLREGVDVELRYMAIPEDWRPPVSGPFKKQTMNSLAQLGLRLGADPASWRTDIPNPESPAP